MEIGQVLEEGWKGKLTLPLTVSNKDISGHTDCQMKQLAKESFPPGCEMCHSFYQKHLLHCLLNGFISVNKSIRKI